MRGDPPQPSNYQKAPRVHARCRISLSMPAVVKRGYEPPGMRRRSSEAGQTQGHPLGGDARNLIVRHACGVRALQGGRQDGTIRAR
jgi:hypothetical protein